MVGIMVLTEGEEVVEGALVEDGEDVEELPPAVPDGVPPRLK